MVNAAETQPPRSHRGQTINAGETIPPGIERQNGQNIVLLAGETVAGSYVIHSRMGKQGSQANVYLAKKWGKSYAVKVYGCGWRPESRIQSFLASVRHPNIAHVVECGDYCGCCYEIYEYYPEGTLEDTGVSSGAHIQNVIVPSVNEGLHELHRNGIVHCDIKPSNLFYADGGSRIVIGDCGISGYTNSDGKLVDAVRGTPEYAPRVRALLWSAAMSPAYDYGSLGLVLCRAVMGRSLFEGMSVEEISKAWEDGLELPSQISGRLGVLIKGLITEEEERRWGYAQVKRWCEGEYMRPMNRSLYAGAKKEHQNKPLIFGRVDGKIISVTSLHQLAQAIKNHWAQALRIVRRRELMEFVRQFDPALTDKVRELASCQDADVAVCKLLMYIEDDSERIYFCGKEYESLADYVEKLSGGRDETAKRFLTSGLLLFYLRCRDYEKSQVDNLELLIRRNGCEDMASVATICFALQGRKSIDIFGEPVESLEDLIPILHKYSVKEIDTLLGSDSLIAWMNRHGFEKEMRRMKEVSP